MKVLVIGAGISGITAARELLDAGIDCEILEARNRIGGRICQAQEFDVPIDLGASWIHQVNGNPLAEVAEKLQLTVDTTCNPYLTGEGGFELYDLNGQALTIRCQEPTRQKFAALTEKGVEMLSNLDTDLSVHEMFVLAHQQLSHLNHEPLLMNWLKAGIEGWENTNLQQLSARNHFGEIENPEFTGGDAFIVDGFFNVMNHLAEGVKCHGANKIHLNQAVKKIEYNDEEVRVETNRGTFTADYVISTFPLGVLQGHTWRAIRVLGA
jgi:monoamine oxidase